MRILGVGATDVGKKRNNNEDSYYVSEEHNLFVVCDGVGGHQAGEVASALAVETLRGILEPHLQSIDTDEPSDEQIDTLEKLVIEALEKACEVVYDRAHASAEQAGMGTTATLLLTVGNRGVMGHVGDTRLYLM